MEKGIVFKFQEGLFIKRKVDQGWAVLQVMPQDIKGLTPGATVRFQMVIDPTDGVAKAAIVSTLPLSPLPPNNRCC